MVKTIEKHINEIFNLLYGSKKITKENTGLMYIRMHSAARIMAFMSCLLLMIGLCLKIICLLMHRLLPT